MRAFGPEEIKRVAMAQMGMRLLPSDVHVLKVEPVMSKRLFERFQQARALEASRAGEEVEEVEEVAAAAVDVADGEGDGEAVNESSSEEGEAGEGGSGHADEACTSARMTATTEDTAERLLAPTLAFHGTPNREALQGILHDGMLAPGERAESTGSILPAMHGKRFGAGRYLSQDVDVASNYALADVTCKQQVPLSLATPPRTPPPSPW